MVDARGFLKTNDAFIDLVFISKPMEMTFSPEKKNDQATALALLGSMEGTILIRRSSSAQGLVFSVAVSRSSIILP